MCGHIVSMFLCVLFAQGCSLIDDDLSVCGIDMEIRLEMQLVTNLDLELETVLSAETDLYTKTILHEYFSHIFTDHAHDINIGFFNTENDALVYSIHDVIDATQSTYTFFLPKNDYHAIALANLDENGVVSLTDSTNSRMARLMTPSLDTLPTQETGLFAVARDVTVIDTADQKIDLTLYMASSAFALLIDTTGVPIKGARAYLVGTADGLMLRDSLFTHDYPRTVRMEEIVENKEERPSQATEREKTALLKEERPFASLSERAKNRDEGARAIVQEEDSVRYLMYGCASFPSPDEPDSKGVYYRAKVYVDLPNGTTTETVLSVETVLQAGQLKVVKTKLQPEGSVVPVGAPEVGASVTLEWKDGGTHTIEF